MASSQESVDSRDLLASGSRLPAPGYSPHGIVTPMIKVCLAGATGWMGKPLSAAISRASDMELVGAVSRTYAGWRLGEVLGEPEVGVTVSGSVAEALETPTGVMVDYTKADAVRTNVLEAVSRGVHVVVGSSGLTTDDYAEIDRLAREKGVGVVAVGNFAITAALLQRFACEAARYLSHWEVVDYASAKKVDAPSGTARELAHRLSEVRAPKVEVPVEETVGLPESRGAELDGNRVHAVRLPGYTIGVEALFGADDERLTIRYDAGPGAEPYIPGTLLAIRKVGGYVGLVRGLDRIMDWD